jgi:hypothetical protein
MSRNEKIIKEETWLTRTLLSKSLCIKTRGCECDWSIFVIWVPILKLKKETVQNYKK